jgi:hypothetical protein
MKKAQHLDRDWLYQKYIVEDLSTYEIGAIVNRDPKRVYDKLRDFGIPTRPRGLNLANGDCYTMNPDNPNPFKGKHHSKETRKVLSEKASVPKPWLRGANNGMYGKTGSDNPNYKDGSAPERQRLYSMGKGKDFLRAILKRDNYACQRCGASHKGGRSLHVHHVKPWAGNPTHRFDPTNVIVLCDKCHNWVHSKANVNLDYLA